MFPIANILLRADLQMFLPIPQPQFPSYLRLSPASPPSIPLRAKPALTLGRVNDRFVIVALTWHVIDTVACFADIALNVASTWRARATQTMHCGKVMLFGLRRYEIACPGNTAKQNRDQRPLL